MESDTTLEVSSVPFSQIDWRIADGLIPRYATHIVVQSGEYDFILSFFAINPPIVFEPPAAGNPPSPVRADCVARIIVPKAKMPEFTKLLQDISASMEQPTTEQE